MWKARAHTPVLSFYHSTHTLEHGSLTHMHVYIHISSTKKIFKWNLTGRISLLVHFFSILQVHLFILPLVSLCPLLSLLSLISQPILFLHQNPTPVSPTPELLLVLSAFIRCVCCSILQ